MSVGWGDDGLVGALFDLADAGLVIADASGTVTRCNDATGPMLGIKVQDAPGSSLTEMLAVACGAERAADMVGGALAGQGWDGHVARPGDDELVLHVRMVPVPGPVDGVIGVACGLWVASRTGSMEATALLESLQRAAPMGHMVFDPEGRYLRVNDAMLAMNAGTRQERVGRNIKDVQPALAGPVRAAIQQVAVTRQPLARQRLEGEVKARPGERKVFRMTYYPVTVPDGQLVGVGAICEDITEAEQAMELAEAAARLTRLLQQATAQMAQALSAEQIATVALGSARTALGATGGGLGVVDPARRVHRFISTFGWDQLALAGLLGDRPLDDNSLSAQALRRGEPIYVRSPEELAPLMPPERARLATEPGRREAWASLPLVGTNGAVGTLALTFPSARDFAEHEKWFLATLAGQAAAAIDRVRRHQAEHQVAVVLQRALLPERLPTVEGLAHAVRYLASAEGVRVGGDWYDMFVLEDGEVALVIGDVAGHGLAAAGAMGNLRAQLRACAHSGLDPAQVLSELDRLVHRLDDDVEQLTTMVYAIWEPAHRAIDLAVAGHPIPLVISGNGARYIDCPPGPPLGAALGPARYEHRRLDLAADEATTLVLYTDGLVERPGDDIQEGLDQLRELASHGDAIDPNDLADHLLAERQPPQGWRDDVALLVCRFAN